MKKRPDNVKVHPYSISRLKPEPKPYDDCKGLALRINPNGTITFLYRFQFSGERRRMSLGTFIRDNIKQGKKQYTTAMTLVEQGIDPINSREKAKNAEKDEPTFKKFAERFLTHYVKANLRPKTITDYERHIKKVFIPAWGKWKLADIERKQIIRLIEKLAKEAPIQANRKLATLKKLFNYAVDVGVLEMSPANGIKPPAKENVKDRVLTLKELATVLRIEDA